MTLDDKIMLDAMVKLTRMFAISARCNPAAEVGLRMATSLVKLWSMNYAPDDPAHPFPDFNVRDLTTGGHLVEVPPVPVGKVHIAGSARAPVNEPRAGDDKARIEEPDLNNLTLGVRSAAA